MMIFLGLFQTSANRLLNFLTASPWNPFLRLEFCLFLNLCQLTLAALLYFAIWMQKNGHQKSKPTNFEYLTFRLSKQAPVLAWVCAIENLRRTLAAASSQASVSSALPVPQTEWPLRRRAVTLSLCRQATQTSPPTRLKSTNCSATRSRSSWSWWPRSKKRLTQNTASLERFLLSNPPRWPMTQPCSLSQNWASRWEPSRIAVHRRNLSREAWGRWHPWTKITRPLVLRRNSRSSTARKKTRSLIILSTLNHDSERYVTYNYSFLVPQVQ